MVVVGGCLYVVTVESCYRQSARYIFECMCVSARYVGIVGDETKGIERRGLWYLCLCTDWQRAKSRSGYDVLLTMV